MSDSIRPITAEEVHQAQELYCNAFKISRDKARQWTDLSKLSHTRAITRDGRIASILTIHPYQIWMFGRVMQMGGLAGVATWADFQGQGLAGRLIKQSIADMNEQGYAISMLYPFSYKYYGRYGYTLAGDRVSYVAHPREFAAFPPDETMRIRVARWPKDLAVIRKVYEDLAPIWNCMMNRSDEQWRHWEHHWDSDHRHVYIIESAEDGEAEAYFTVEDIPLKEGFEARVTEILLSTELHMAQMARFFARSAANVHRVRLIVPRTGTLWQFFSEPTIETRLTPVFMARVINVPAACSSRGYESDVADALIFAIDDPCGPWNAGPWQLAVSDGRAVIAKAEAENPLILTIQEFSAIFTGYQKASELVVDQPEHLEALEALDDIFYDGETRLLDFF